MGEDSAIVGERDTPVRAPVDDEGVIHRDRGVEAHARRTLHVAPEQPRDVAAARGPGGAAETTLDDDGLGGGDAHGVLPCARSKASPVPGPGAPHINHLRVAIGRFALARWAEDPPGFLDSAIRGRMRSVRYHFSGVAGAGMNPLARLMRARGHRVQGSDRAIDRGAVPETEAVLRGDGVGLVPHDGSAITPEVDRFVYSTAVEAETPEVAAARALGIPMLARPALLAEVVDAGRPGVAISGTCGKSTVTGMVGWLVEQGGVPATVVGGAPRVGEGVAGGFSRAPRAGRPSRRPASRTGR